MNAKTIKHNVLLSLIGVALSTSLIGESHADEVCVTDPTEVSTITICVDWSLPDDPDHGFDFVVDFTDPDYPDLELRTGATWRVWSRDPDDYLNYGNIGMITSPHPEDFGVKIEDDFGGAGARDVKGIILDPQGEGSEGNYSLIVGGSILGDVMGDLFVQASNNPNPEVSYGHIKNLSIGGNVEGNIDAYLTKNLRTYGDVNGNITIEIGRSTIFGGSTYGVINVHNLDNGWFILGDPTADISCNGWYGSTVFGPVQIDYIGRNGNLGINGHLVADLTVAELYGQVHQWGHVGGAEGAVTVTVTINDMVQTYGYTFIKLGWATQNFPEWPCSFYGDLFLESGVKENTSASLNAFLESGSSINLNNRDVAGSLRVFLGGAGTIVNGGAVTSTGIVNLGDAAQFPVSFSGTATVTSVSNGGIIRTQSSADLDGTVHVTGDMAGDINLGYFGEPRGPSDLLANGKILIDGDTTGNITVDGNVEGDITVTGDLMGAIDIGADVTGDITVQGNATGNIDVGGKLKAGAASNVGRIFVEGLLTGGITIAEETQDLTLIRVTEGIASGANVIINDSRGPADTDGTVHVGSAAAFPLGDVTFDGGIKIRNEDGGPGGDFGGTIKVVGCHATDADLDICICGVNNGTVQIVQTGCNNQVGWSCALPGCP